MTTRHDGAVDFHAYWRTVTRALEEGFTTREAYALAWADMYRTLGMVCKPAEYENEEQQ